MEDKDTKNNECIDHNKCSNNSSSYYTIINCKFKTHQLKNIFELFVDKLHNYLLLYTS